MAGMTRWTKKEVATLRALYADHTAREIEAVLFARSAWAIKQKAVALGPHKERRVQDGRTDNSVDRRNRFHGPW
jgi:hypothetical protein